MSAISWSVDRVPRYSAVSRVRKHVTRLGAIVTRIIIVMSVRYIIPVSSIERLQEENARVLERAHCISGDL